MAIDFILFWVNCYYNTAFGRAEEMVKIVNKIGNAFIFKIGEITKNLSTID